MGGVGVDGRAILIGILLVSGSGLGEENAVEVFHHYDVHLNSSFLIFIGPRGTRMGSGEGSTMRNFMVCTVHLILVRVSKSRRLRWAGHIARMDVTFQVFSGGNNKVVLFPFSFHIYIPSANMWIIRRQIKVSHPNFRKFP